MIDLVLMFLFQDVDSPSQVIPRYTAEYRSLFVSLFILLNTSAFFGFYLQNCLSPQV